MSALEKRLQLIAAWCAPFARVADIGAGSGRLSRALAEQGHAVIATEVRPEGLAHLMAGLKESTTLPRITAMMGNGLDPIRDRAVDVVVVAGMGPATIFRILEQYADLPLSPPVIIQPAQGLWHVHRLLASSFWEITRAGLVADGGRLYGTWQLRRGNVRREADARRLVVPCEFRSEAWYCRLLSERLAWLQSLSRHRGYPPGLDAQVNWVAMAWRDAGCSDST
ncbi:MAG: tRNA (adenine(22)-N(1))-methyltransferase TrmK [Thermaerobacter sp.]|nr:tRNA (adenine(22)-N(1))-methyltransferase TrmK [Thermaerobacter sp.]